LTETTYHEKKLYIPAEIREKLGLKPGEKLDVTLLDRRSFKVELQRKLPEEELLEALEDPPEIGVPDTLTRREIYEDIR
jgi:AbrB family looped-hinge helix DNA binding protein